LPSHEAVVCEGLVKEYGSRGKKVTALDHVSLAVKEGEVFGLLGPNGAGKTTLIKILSTLLRPTAGKATVLGYNVERDEAKVRRIVGYAGQDTERSAYFRLTAKENLVYFAHALRGIPRGTVLKRMREMTEVFDFADKLDKLFVTLSGGEKQAVVVMRALLHNPRVVFLDEPSKSLDPIIAKKVREYLRKYAMENHATVFITTHNMQEAEELSDRLALINRGRVSFVGTPFEFKNAIPRQEVIRVALPSLSEDLQSKLLKIGSVVNVVHEGNAVKVYCTDGLEALPGVAETLKSAGIKALVTMSEPSVEDAFIQLVQREDEGEKQ